MSVRVGSVDGNEADYEAFLSRHEGALLYHSLRYRDFLAALTGARPEYLVALDGGGVTGVLPLMVLASGGRLVYNSLPYFGSNGGVLADNNAARDALISVYASLACGDKVVSSTIVTTPRVAFDPAGVPYTHTDERIGLLTRLATGGDPERDILSRVDSRTRRALKKAAREGVTVEADASAMQEFRAIHQTTMNAIGGTPKDDRFFDLVPRFFREGVDFDLWAARHSGKVVGGIIVFYYNRTAEYYTPAIAEHARPTQALAQACLTAMVASAARGYEWWNWGGTWTTQDGVYQFKKQWDPHEVRYRYYTQLNDVEVLSRTRESILAAFPNFYVVPFSALRSHAA